MTNPFKSTVYVRKGCPFCMKLRLFLLESGQLDHVTIVEGQDDAEHQKLSDHLTTQLGKASFPSAEIAPADYLADSDALVAHYAAATATDPAALPVYQAYVGHVMPRLQQLFRENMELKQQLGQARS